MRAAQLADANFREAMMQRDTGLSQGQGFFGLSLGMVSIVCLV